MLASDTLISSADTERDYARWGWSSTSGLLKEIKLW